MMFNLVGCGAKLQTRAKDSISPEACTLPLHRANQAKIDTLIDFLRCFKHESTLIRMADLLEGWKASLGPEAMDSLFLPLTIALKQPNWVSAWAEKVGHSQTLAYVYERRAQWETGLQRASDSELVGWLRRWLGSVLKAFEPELNSFRANTLKPDAERALWIASLFEGVKETLTVLRNTPARSPEQFAQWTLHSDAFWNSLVEQVREPEVQDWIGRHAHHLIDFLLRFSPDQTLLKALLSPYPDSLLEFFAKTVWSLYHGRSNSQVLSLDRYVKTHVKVLFDPIWSLNDVHSIFSRSLPITFQLFYTQNYQHSEIHNLQDLVSQVANLNQQGALAAFIHLVREIFDHEESQFWALMHWYGQGEGTWFFEGLSYYFNTSPWVAFFRQPYQIPEKLSGFFKFLASDRSWGSRMVQLWPEVENTESWIQDWSHLGSFLSENGGAWAEAGLAAPWFENADSQAVWIGHAHWFLGELIRHSESETFLKTLGALLLDSRMDEWMSLCFEFALSGDMGGFLSQVSQFGKRFLETQPPSSPSPPFHTVLAALSPKVSLAGVVSSVPHSWVGLRPPTGIEQRENAIIQAALRAPEQTPDWSWVLMGISNTFYYYFLPHYPNRDRFLSWEVWKQVTRAMVDFPVRIPPPVKSVLPVDFSLALPRRTSARPTSHPCDGRDVLRCLLHRVQVSNAQGQTMAERFLETLRGIMAMGTRLEGVADRLMSLSQQNVSMSFDAHTHGQLKYFLEKVKRRDDRDRFRSVIEEVDTYLGQVGLTPTREQSFALQVGAVGPQQRSILDQLEQALVLADQSVEIESDSRRIEGFFNKQMASQLRDGLGGKPFYESLAMHFLVNLTHGNLQDLPVRLPFLMDQILIETVGRAKDASVRQNIEGFVDVQESFNQGALRAVLNLLTQFGWTFSGKKLCLEQGICTLKSALTAAVMIPQVAVLEYVGRKQPGVGSSGESVETSQKSLIEMMGPLLKLPLEFTKVAYRTQHSTIHNHLGIFLDLAHAGLIRRLRTWILHWHGEGQLVSVLEGLKRYLEAYGDLPNRFDYLRVWLRLADQKKDLLERLFRRIHQVYEALGPHDQALLMDAVWVGVTGVVSQMEGRQLLGGPQVDALLAAFLEVLDESWVQRIEKVVAFFENEGGSGFREQRSAFLAWGRFIRFVVQAKPIAKLMVEMLYNMIASRYLAPSLDFSERKERLQIDMQNVIDFVNDMETKDAMTIPSPQTLGSRPEVQDFDMAAFIDRIRLLGQYWDDLFLNEGASQVP
jgi:hypothetical protein